MRFVLLSLTCLALMGCQEEKGLLTSPAGHEFAFLQRPDANIVAIQVAFPMDWAVQQGRNPAVPTIAAEVMTTGGAEGYLPEEVLESFQDMGAEAFLYPELLTLRGGLNVPPEQVEAAVTLANAVLRAPSFDAGWMARSKEALMSNMQAYNAQSAAQGQYALRLAMMGDTPFTESQALTDGAAIGAVTQEMLQDWHRATVTQGNVLVAVAGPISAKDAGLAVDKLLDGLAQSDKTFVDPPVPAYQPRQILLHLPSAEKTTLTLVAPIPKSDAKSDFIDILGAVALGGDDQSLLFKAIRTDLRASYGMAAGLDMYSRNARVLVMSGEVETAQTAAVRDLVVRTYQDMAQKPLDEATVTRWRDVFSDGFEQLKDDTTNRATTMVEAMLYGLDPLMFEQSPQWIAALSPASLAARYATDYPKAADLTVIAVSPDANALPEACVITAPQQVLTCP